MVPVRAATNNQAASTAMRLDLPSYFLVGSGLRLALIDRFKLENSNRIASTDINICSKMDLEIELFWDSDRVRDDIFVRK